MDKKTSILLRKYLKNNEGIRKHVYEDKFQIPSIGIGYNLKQEQAKNHFKQIGANWNEVVIKGAELTDEQIEKLFEITINQFERIITNIFPSFNDLSPVRQIVLFDLLFNLGPTRLSAFKNLREAVKTKNWTWAELEIINSQYAKQLPGRSARNATALRNNTLPEVLRTALKKPKNKSSQNSSNRDYDNHGHGENRPEPRDDGDFRGPGPLG